MSVIAQLLDATTTEVTILAGRGEKLPSGVKFRVRRVRLDEVLIGVGEIPASFNRAFLEEVHPRDLELLTREDLEYHVKLCRFMLLTAVVDGPVVFVDKPQAECRKRDGVGEDGREEMSLDLAMSVPDIHRPILHAAFKLNALDREAAGMVEKFFRSESGN